MGIVNSGANPKRIAGHTHFPHAASPECSASPKKADEGSRGGGGGGTPTKAKNAISNAKSYIISIKFHPIPN